MTTSLPSLRRTPVKVGEGSTAPRIRAVAEYSTRVLRSPEEVLSVRDHWEKWVSDPTCDIDHFLLVCRIRKNVRGPHVIVVSKGDEPVAMLVTRLEDCHIAPSVGYFKPIQFSIRSLSMVYSGVLGLGDQAAAEVLVKSLRKSLEKREADVVTLYQLPEQSPLLAAALRQTSTLWRDVRPSLSLHWQLDLHNKPGGLLQMITSKHRGVIRRSARDLENAHPGGVSFEAFLPGGDVGKLCESLEAVARLTYQRGLGEGFRNDVDHRERFELFNRLGALRAWILRIDGVPRAFCVGFAYRGVFHFSETGYDPDFRSHGIGTLIFLHMTDALIQEGLAKFDYGLGDAEYKQRFSDRSWQEATLRLYAPTPKSLAMRSCVGCFNTAGTLGKRFANRLGIADKLKRAWRGRLANQTKSGAAT